MTFFLLVAFCLFLGCERKPIEPKPKTEYYYFLVALNPESVTLFRFDTKTRQVDSTEISGGSNTFVDATYSPATDRLYITVKSSVAVLDPSTMLVVDSLNYDVRHITVSNDGGILAMEMQGGGLTFLDARTKSVIKVLSRKTGRGTFSVDGKSFSCTIGDGGDPEGFDIALVDLLTWEVTDHFPGNASLSSTFEQTEKMWYCYFTAPFYAGYMFRANSADSVLDELIVDPGVGRMLYERRKRRIYFTAPGNFISSMPRPFLYWTNADSLDHLDSIDVSEVQNDGYWPEFVADGIAKSEDGNLIVYAESAQDRLLVLRQSDNRIVDTIAFGRGFAEVALPAVVSQRSE